MSTINTLYSGQYYQLPDSSTTASTAATGSTATSTTDSTSSSSALNNAYLLDLSPDAQSYLNGLTSTSGSTSSLASALSGLTSDSGSTSSSASGAVSSDATFTLSSAQETKLTAIIDKYKSLPLTQANYDDMQNDLKAAGLSPDQLSGQDEVQSFNATSTLLDALNGVEDPIASASQTLSNEQTKANNYMSQIVSLWQNSQSSDTASSTDSGSDTSASAVTAAGATS